jgi:hypothetical protein
MRSSRKTAAVILLTALASAAPISAVATDVSTPEPVAKAVGDVLHEISEPRIAGFLWGSPLATLAASKEVRPSAGFSAKCAADIVSVGLPDCTAFVPRSQRGFVRAYYATSRDGLLMVESNTVQFDCGRFEDMASPAAGHRAELARMGWSHLRRDRRPEGETMVETQLFARQGIGVELTFVKVARTAQCGVQAFVSKTM